MNPRFEKHLFGGRSLQVAAWLLVFAAPSVAGLRGDDATQSLRLVALVDGKSVPVVKVADRQLMIEVDGGLQAVPAGARLQIEGELKAHADLVWTNIRSEIVTQVSVDATPEAPTQDYALTRFGAPETKHEAALLLGWQVEGRLVTVNAIPIRTEQPAEQERSEVPPEIISLVERVLPLMNIFELSDDWRKGSAVALCFEEGGFVSPMPTDVAMGGRRFGAHATCPAGDRSVRSGWADRGREEHFASVATKGKRGR